MECPKCKKVSSDSTHCTFCGWQEPLPSVGSSKEPKDLLNPKEEPIQESLQIAAQPENKQPEVNPEGGAQLLNGAPEQKPGKDGMQPQPSGELNPESPQIKAKAEQKPDKKEGNSTVSKEPAKVVEATKNEEDKMLEAEKRIALGEGKKKDKEKIEVLNSRMKQLNVVKGDKNIFAEKLHQFQEIHAKQGNRVEGDKNIIVGGDAYFSGPAKGNEVYEEKSYIEFTIELPGKDADIPDLAFDDLEAKATILQRERVLLINCIDSAFAKAAAYALIEMITPYNSADARLLDFNRIEAENFDIYLFLNKRVDTDAQVAIVANCTGDKAQKFLDSLYAAWSSFKSVKREMESNKLFLICLIDSENADKRLNDENSELQSIHWKIPFLRHLLRSCFPDQYLDLEKRILEQRASGRWSEEESDFCRQVRSYLKSSSLDKEIKLREVAGKPISEELIFDDDKPVHSTVLYTASFFPRLSPNEFNRVVSTLIGTQTTTVTQNAQQIGEDGVKRQIEIQSEKQLIQIWRENSDKILRECKLISSKEANRAIDFADVGQRNNFKRYLEEEYGLFVQNKFTFIQESGLLFDASERIAKKVIGLILDMAASYPDYYGKDWLFDLISKVRSYFDSAQPGSDEPMLQLLGKPGGLRAENQVYKRLSDLMRDMLDDTELKPIIKGLLEQLMTAGFYDSVLNLVKSFRFVPGLDEFYWMKQLLDRGNETIRLQTYILLYKELKRMDKQVYQILRRIAGWLPSVETDPERYSHSNIVALRLMIEYCLETTSNFDAKNYGSWPSQYSLLATKDAKEATRNFELLAGWVFHPGMQQVMVEDFDEDLDRLLPALVSEWSFILLGQAQQSDGFHNAATNSPEYDSESDAENAAAAQDQTTANAIFTAEAAFNILLKQIIEKTNTLQQKRTQEDMLRYWEEMKDFLATITEIFGYTDRKQRKEFIWKRNLIRKLLVQFRALQKDSKTSRLQELSA
jgi:uncharacterized protein YaaR (DUF327 family)